MGETDPACWDLVVADYAPPDSSRLVFYQRIASWVALGGTLLILGHLHGSDHGHGRPEGTTRS